MPHTASLLNDVICALEIAMDYLDRTGQVPSGLEARRHCAHVIVNECHYGGRSHPIWLANKAIASVERDKQAINLGT